MCEALEGAQLHTEASYQKFLKIDEHLSRIVDNPPRWLTKSQTGESYEVSLLFSMAFDFVVSSKGH